MHRSDLGRKRRATTGPVKQEWILYDPENKLAEERRNAGLNILEMCRRIGLGRNYSTYRAVELGVLSPLCRNGKVRPYIQKACDELGLLLEDLFPREVCAIARGGDGLVECQLEGLVMAQEQKSVEFLSHARLEIRSALQSIPAREREAVIRYVVLEETLDEVGKKLGVSRGRADQIVAHGLRRLRHPERGSRLMGLEDL